MRTYPLEDVQVTEFSGETPPELASALSNPNLSGWTPGSGAYVVRQGHESTGLTVFERGEERMLCSLWHGADGWFFLPVGDKALLPGREVTVRYGGGGAFELRYPISDAESEVFSVTPIALAAAKTILCATAASTATSMKTPIPARFSRSTAKPATRASAAIGTA